MYQQEMFEQAFKGAAFLGAGCYGEVHAIDKDWVVKYAQNDCTRNWLEWCLLKQGRGEHMRGMPVIDRLSDTGEGRYMVTMRRYREDKGAYMDVACDVLDGPWGLDYTEALFAAFHADMCAAFPLYADERGDRDDFPDRHSGNILYDDASDTWIVTDPSGGSYYRCEEPNTFYLN